MRKILLLVAVVLFAGAFPARAADIPELAVARNAFLRALDDKGGSLEDAIRRFDALLAKDPANPVYNSYRGACMTVRGRDAWFPWNKMRYTEQGLDRVDKALSSLGNYAGNSPLEIHLRLETKLVAARTFLSVPDRYFHRAGEGRRLLMEITRSPDYERMGEEFHAVVQQTMAQAKENG